jgi:hypothetical protein
MKVHELIELLQGYDPDTEVMIAHQPNWPLRETIQSVASLEDIREDDEDWTAATDDEQQAEEDAEGNVVYLVAGGHPWDGSPYAPKALWAR